MMKQMRRGDGEMVCEQQSKCEGGNGRRRRMIIITVDGNQELQSEKATAVYNKLTGDDWKFQWWSKRETITKMRLSIHLIHTQTVEGILEMMRGTLLISLFFLLALLTLVSSRWCLKYGMGSNGYDDDNAFFLFSPSFYVHFRIFCVYCFPNDLLRQREEEESVVCVSLSILRWDAATWTRIKSVFWDKCMKFGVGRSEREEKADYIRDTQTMRKRKILSTPEEKRRE